MIYLKDAVEGLKETQSNSADCIILDPPYNIGKDFGNNKTKMSNKEYISWCMKWYVDCKRILKDSGTMFIYGFPEILAHLSVSMDLEHKWLQWHYTNKTVPSLNFWQRSHESILCIWKDKSKRVYNRDKVRVPYTDNYVKGYKDKKRIRPNAGSRYGKSDKTSYVVNDKGALPKDVLKVPSLAGGSGERFLYSPSQKKLFSRKNAKKLNIVDGISHPTQKPIKLTETLLDSCIPEGNVSVVIPFTGTGSECYVCEKRGYTWKAYEINQDYYDMANLLVKNGFPKNS